MKNKLEFRKDTYNHNIYVPEFWINMQDHYIRMFSSNPIITTVTTISKAGWEFLDIIEYEE